MITLKPAGQVYTTRAVPTWTVLIDGVAVGTAHKDKGVYFFGGFSGSRARLLQHLAATFTPKG